MKIFSIILLSLTLLFLSTNELPAQIQPNSLSAGLGSKFLYADGDYAMAEKIQFLYSVSEYLAVGYNFEYFTTGSGEFDTRAVAFQPTKRIREKVNEVLPFNLVSIPHFWNICIFFVKSCSKIPIISLVQDYGIICV